MCPGFKISNSKGRGIQAVAETGWKTTWTTISHYFHHAKGLIYNTIATKYIMTRLKDTCTVCQSAA